MNSPVRILLYILAIPYLISFFLPAFKYYGSVAGYELIFSYFVIGMIPPNALVINTFFNYKKHSSSTKRTLLILFLLTGGFYIFIDFGHRYPFYKSLLSGFWLWFFTSLTMMIIVLFEKQSPSESVDIGTNE